LINQIVGNQWKFHFDTKNLRCNSDKIKPTDIISISDKWHGTSVIISKLLTKKNLSCFTRQINKIIPLKTEEYSLIYSSRKIIKAINGVSYPGKSYSSDIWGDVAKELEDKIPSGYTLYGEIVGFTAEGKSIQGGYSYGCFQNKLEFPQHKFVLYRVTSTNSEGHVIELSWEQMKEFSSKYGILMVKEFYYGTVWNLWNLHNTEQLSVEYNKNIEWHSEDFIKLLEKLYVYDQMCLKMILKYLLKG
jgi:hypothetical protein